MKNLGILIAGLLAVSGCATSRTGALDIGAAAGAAANPPTDPAPALTLAEREATTGVTVASAIITAMNGGLIGGDVGSELSDGERYNGLVAEYRALEYGQGGQVIPWVGRAENKGEVVASQPYRVGSQDCRQYTQTVYAGGPARSAKGTACRNPSGSWTPLT